MTKVKLTLTVDDQLIARAKMLRVNLSSLLEDVLRGDELRRRRHDPRYPRGRKRGRWRRQFRAPSLPSRIGRPPRRRGPIWRRLWQSQAPPQKVSLSPNSRLSRVASMPLAETFGYTTVIRSLTQGRATHSIEFLHYQEVPRHIGEEIELKGKGNA